MSDDQLSKQAQYSRRQSTERAEIGPPPLTDEQRAEGRRLWELCRTSLEAFNVEVFPNSTGLKPFGEVQRQSVKHDETVIVTGGKICKAEPRAYGKTTRTCHAALWGVLYGLRRMVPVFSASLTKSKDQIIASWKSDIMGNERLLWMFPDLIWPLRALENKHQRCDTQTYNGELTHTRWTAERIVFPHVEGVPGSGAILVALPLKSCRGVNHPAPNGEIIRPDLVIFDDVQKDEDARNPATITKMMDDIEHGAMMLGGYSQTMSAIMNCTVRFRDDLSEQYLKKPGWRRVRYKMLTKPSVNEAEFWFGRYATTRNSYDPEDAEDQERAHLEARALYEKEFEFANEGAEVSWDWAYAWADENPTEISAIQRAYNTHIDRGPAVFASECQNEPLRANDDINLLSHEVLADKVLGYQRGLVPDDCSIVTAFTDVQAEYLFWMVCGWSPDFTGYVLDYGTWPNQGRDYFRRHDPPNKLSVMYPGDENSRLFSALTDLGAAIAGRTYSKREGAGLSLSRWCIDTGWATTPIAGYTAQSAFRNIISMTKGVYVGARSITTFDEAQRAKEWRTTHGHWFWADGPGPGKKVRFDANHWKTRVHKSLAMPKASRGGIHFFSDTARSHRMLFDHLMAEKARLVEAKGRSLLEWEVIPGRDNEGLDCLVGCAVAASIAGIVPDSERVRAKAVPLLSLADYARMAGK